MNEGVSVRNVFFCFSIVLIFFWVIGWVLIKVKFKNSYGVMGSYDLRRIVMGLERVYFFESAWEGERESEERSSKVGLWGERVGGFYKKLMWWGWRGFWWMS